MSLPQVPQSKLDIREINWAGLPKRFMNPGELEALIALVRSVHPKAVLEFGVNEGRTAKAILDNVPGIESYQGIDVPLGYIPTKAVQIHEVPAQPAHLVKADPRFELILRPHGSHDLNPGDLKPCDAVFIDGDHSFKGVMHDTMLARKLVRPGGIIVWHDYHDLGTVDVRDVLDEFHKAGDDIVHVEGTWLAFQMV